MIALAGRAERQQERNRAGGRGERIDAGEVDRDGAFVDHESVSDDHF